MKIHQGDIILIKKASRPRDAKEVRKEVVAFGEATGHHHRIPGATVIAAGGLEYVVVPEDTEMTHEEHPAIAVPAGVYEIRHQVEYWPGQEPRKVID